MSISTIPSTSLSKTVVGTASTPAVPTQVDGVNIAAAFEVQSTDGGFVPPRMTGAQMNALTPVTPGMQVFVTDAATVPSGTYIRQMDNTWKIVDVSVSDEIAVTISSSDLPDVKRFSCAIFTDDEEPQLLGTDITITGGDDISGLFSIDTFRSDGDPLSSGTPVYGMNYDRAASTEGIGTYEVGSMTLWANASPQAIVKDLGTNGSNCVQLSGSNVGDPVQISALSLASETDVSIYVNPLGAGQVLTNNGSTTNPSYSFMNAPGDGMYSVGLGTVGFTAGGIPQVEISNVGDGTNSILMGGSSTGNPVSIRAIGANSNVSIYLNTKGSSGQVLTNSGAGATPSYSFSGNTGYGMFKHASGLGFSANAIKQVLINDSNTSDGSNFLVLSGSATGDAVTISSAGSDPTIDLTLSSGGGGNINFLSGNNLQARVSNIGGDGTNFLTIFGTSTTNPVTLFAEGSDTDVSLQLSTHGNGSVVVNTLDGDRVNFGVGIDPLNVNASSNNNIYIGNGAAPSIGVSDTIQIYSTDLTAGNTTLALWTEGTNVSDTVDTTPTKNIAIKVNGTTYYLMAKTIV